MKGYQIKRIVAVGSVTLLALLSSHTFASGFRVVFQSVSTLADAGDAAVVNDASTNWYNSAGLVYLPQQTVFGAFDAYAPVTFNGTTTAPNTNGFSFTGSGTSNAHTNVILPLLHYSRPLTETISFGLSVVPAWGLAEYYGTNVATRYDLVRIYTRTIDIEPSLAMRFNDRFSIGVGPDMHYFSLQQRSASRLQFLGPTQGDSYSRSVGQDWGYGAHIGALYRFNDSTRVGLNYRTKIVHDLRGYSHLSFNGAAAIGQTAELETNQFNLRIIMPPTTSLSIYHDVNDKIAVMGTVVYDQWATSANLYATNYQSLNPAGGSALVNVSLPKGYHNTFDFGAGAHYKYSEKLMLRFAVKYEDTPTTDTYRDIEFPDGEKLGIHIGASYNVTPKIRVDGIYGHVFVKNQSINATVPLTGVTNVGTSKMTVNFIGAEMVWNI